MQLKNNFDPIVLHYIRSVDFPTVNCLLKFVSNDNQNTVKSLRKNLKNDQLSICNSGVPLNLTQSKKTVPNQSECLTQIFETHNKQSNSI